MTDVDVARTMRRAWREGDAEVLGRMRDLDPDIALDLVRFLVGVTPFAPIAPLLDQSLALDHVAPSVRKAIFG